MHRVVGITIAGSEPQTLNPRLETQNPSPKPWTGAQQVCRLGSTVLGSKPLKPAPHLPKGGSIGRFGVLAGALHQGCIPDVAAIKQEEARQAWLPGSRCRCGRSVPRMLLLLQAGQVGAEADGGRGAGRGTLPDDPGGAAAPCWALALSLQHTAWAARITGSKQHRQRVCEAVPCSML
jgi:hypothetical protein